MQVHRHQIHPVASTPGVRMYTVVHHHTWPTGVAHPHPVTPFPLGLYEQLHELGSAAPCPLDTHHGH